MTLHNEDKGSLRTQKAANGRSSDTCVSANAGICGFTCRIKARKIDKKTVGLEISESECQQIQQLAELMSQLTLNEIFMPVTRNPVYLAAEQSGCHASCPIPVAILKAAEVALEMALPRDAFIRFEPCKGEEV
jgi:hypothetical protein